MRGLLTVMFVSVGTATAIGASAAPPIEGLTVQELHYAFATHRLSVQAVEQYYTSRIAKIDSSGPAVRSILELNPDAARLARELDARVSHRGPLFGIPVLLKDNVDTADDLHTTAGSLALLDSRPIRDAFIVQRLRDSGALILGKTNMSEWANFRSTRSSSGWSGRGGQTKNPYALNRNPCGSSSGSASALAAGLVTLAVGTETDGSIVCPSSVAGLVGIKPTVGLVSRNGIIPISASQDTAGPMARTVADAATLLTVLAGYDPEDPATETLRDHPPPDYTANPKPDSLRGARIGVLRQYTGFHEGVDAIFERALSVLCEHGAVLIDPIQPEIVGPYRADEITVLLYEFKEGINRYLATRQGDSPRTLAELIVFNEKNETREMPFFGQELFLSAQAKGGLDAPEYLTSRERAQRRAKEAIDMALARDHLSALIAPTVGPAWVTDYVNGDHTLGGRVSMISAVAGYPHVTVPMGNVRGLPVGLSFVGSAWSEDTLISYAYAFEQATRFRRPPTFRPSVP